MILQLLTTSLLIIQGVGGYNLAYKQNDNISTSGYNYDIEQEVYITDDDNLYISFNIYDEDNDEYLKVEAEYPLVDYMPWLVDTDFYEFPKSLYSLPVVWFGVDQGYVLYNNYDLVFSFEGSLVDDVLHSVIINPYNDGNLTDDISVLQGFGSNLDFILDYMESYYGSFYDYDLDSNLLTLYQGNFWSYSSSSNETLYFSELTIDLVITYGHIQYLYDMKYDSSGLGYQINELISNSFDNGYDDGYSDGLNDGYNIRNDLYLPFKNAIIVGAYRNENGEITFVDRYNLELVNGIYDFSSVVADIEDIANDEPDYNSSEDAYINIELESGVRASDITFDIIGFEDMVITYSDGVNKYYNDLFPLNYTTIQDDSNKFISSIELTFNMYDNLQDYKLGIQVSNDYANGFDNGFSEGEQAVIRNPNNYGLFDENQYENHYQNGYNNGKLDAEVPVGLNWVKAAINVFFGFLGFMILPGVTLGDIFSGLIILLILKWVLSWFRG